MIEVKAIIAEYTLFKVHEIKDDMLLETDLGMDSLARLEIAGACEEAFELEDIPEAELREASTVKHVIDLVNKYRLSI